LGFCHLSTLHTQFPISDTYAQNCRIKFAFGALWFGLADTEINSPSRIHTTIVE